jgi:hypothetical protein
LIIQEGSFDALTALQLLRSSQAIDKYLPKRARLASTWPVSKADADDATLIERIELAVA